MMKDIGIKLRIWYLLFDSFIMVAVRLCLRPIRQTLTQITRYRTIWKTLLNNGILPRSNDLGILFFIPPSWKMPGASSNRIVCPSIRLSVSNSVPLTNKVQYLKFWWWYSNHTWTVSSSMGSSHFTDIQCPWGRETSKCRTYRFLPYFDFVAAGGTGVS